MAEPARTLPISPEAAEAGSPMLQRWIEHPDGRLELLVRPLTPEDFLHPQLEDSMTQGKSRTPPSDGSSQTCWIATSSPMP